MCCACAGTCNHVGSHWFCSAHGGTTTTGAVTTTASRSWPLDEFDVTEAQFDAWMEADQPVKPNPIPRWCANPLLRGFVMGNALAAPLLLIVWAISVQR